MMLSDVCLSDVCCVHPVGGRRVRQSATKNLSATFVSKCEQPVSRGDEDSMHSLVHAVSSKEYNLSPASSEMTTVVLASHQPCGADRSGISTYRLTAIEREINSHQCSIWSYAPYLFTFNILPARYYLSSRRP